MGDGACVLVLRVKLHFVPVQEGVICIATGASITNKYLTLAKKDYLSRPTGCLSGSGRALRFGSAFLLFLVSSSFTLWYRQNAINTVYLSSTGDFTLPTIYCMGSSEIGLPGSLGRPT